MKMETREVSPSTLLTEESFTGPRKKKMKNKRRFSDEQIRSLESRFEQEMKLEPQKKVQLARDLGLQPRQIAIWFQNKRARWKSKQLEQEYSALKAEFDALASSFESLKEEKQCLLKQLQKLGNLLEKQQENRDAHSHDRDTKCNEHEEKLLVEKGSDLKVVVYSDGENGKNDEGFGPNEQELLSTGETVDGSWTLLDWSDFHSGCFSDQSCHSMQWWDLWH